MCPLTLSACAFNSGRGFSPRFNGTRAFADRGVFGRGDHGRFGDRGFRGRDRGFRDRRFRDFDGDFFDFGFYGFGYPDYYQYDYPYYYPYPYYNYDTFLDVDNSADYRSPTSGEVASIVQSALGKRGYDRGPIDGVIGAGSRRAVRSFQTDQGLPVTGSIDNKLLRALRIG
jgi:Putative peptidoglycan binding domain